jgi:hypothetical protein
LDQIAGWFCRQPEHHRESGSVRFRPSLRVVKIGVKMPDHTRMKGFMIYSLF